MAWEWSHTQEAYRDAETNFRNLPLSTQAVIYAEWQAAELGDFEPQFNDHKYRRELRRAHSLARRSPRHWQDCLDMVWERVEGQAICTNGGWEAWLCPFGCGCHMVPFDREGKTK